MKKALLILAGAALVLSSCNNKEILSRLDQHDQDIAGLQNNVRDLQSDVAGLKDAVAQINSNISALQTIVDALQNNDYVTGVENVKDDKGNVIGYTIKFSKSAPITIYHGEKGAKGDKGDKGDQGDPGEPGAPGKDGVDGNTPVIGVKESGGVYYWTIDGKILTDAEGHPIPVTGNDGAPGNPGNDGKDGITPQLRINEGNWEVSYDEGETWTVVGPAQTAAEGGQSCDCEDAVFSDVKETKSAVVFTLSDGSTLRIDKLIEFSLNMDDSAVTMAGEATEIPYTLSGVGNGESRVDAIASGDWWAEAVAADKFSGVIKVTAGEAAKAKVIVYAVDGKGRSDMRSLIFDLGTLTVTAPVEDAPAEGGSIEVPVVTNVDYSVVIEEDARGWLSAYVATKAEIRNETLVLVVEKNNAPETRTGLVELKDANGATIQSFTVKQESGVYEYPEFDDSSFKNWVLYNSPAADYNENLKVDASEAAKVTEINFAKDKAFTSLKGIECFYNLKKITIANTSKLASLDLSKNKKLEEVTISKEYGAETVLVTLNLEDLHALKTVQIGGMSAVETLTLGSAPALTALYAYNTALKALDVTGAPALVNLAVYGTKIEELDLSKNTVLESASVGISTLATLSLPASLKTLSMDNAVVTSLDLSPLTNLTEFSAAATKMETIDLSASKGLLKFSVGSYGGSGKSTVLKKVDLRNATLLSTVNLYSDALEEVIVPKGTNRSSWNWTSYHMDPDTGEYTYVTVTEVELENDGPAIDDYAAGIKDAFVKKIVLGKYDKNDDGKIDAAEAEAVTELDFTGCELEDGDLAGLESLPVKKLLLAGNRFTEFDILAWPSLEWINLNNNKLTSLSIGTKTADLKQTLHLEAANNQIATFTVPSYAKANIKYLDLSNNLVSKFPYDYVYGWTDLEYFNLANNKLTKLSFNSTLNVKEINVSNNQLTAAAYTSMSKLEKVDVSNNLLTSYAFGASQYALEEVNLASNKIKSIDITNIAKAADKFAIKKIDMSGNEGFNLVIVGAGNQMPEGLEVIADGEFGVLNAANPSGYKTNEYNNINEFFAGDKAVYGDITLNFSLATKGFKIEDGGEAYFTAKANKKVFNFFAVATSGTPQIELVRESGKTILTKDTDSSPYGASYAATGTNPLSPAMNESAAKDWTNFIQDGNGAKMLYHFSLCGKSDGNTTEGEKIYFKVTGGTAVIFGINLSGYRVDEQ